MKQHEKKLKNDFIKKNAVVIASHILECARHTNGAWFMIRGTWSLHDNNANCAHTIYNPLSKETELRNVREIRGSPTAHKPNYTHIQHMSQRKKQKLPPARNITSHSQTNTSARSFKKKKLKQMSPGMWSSHVLSRKKSKHPETSLAIKQTNSIL